MGRGDKKSAKGNRTIGSYGVSRQKKKTTYKPSATTATEETVKKAAVKKETEPKAEVKKPAAKKPAVAKKVKEETSTEE